MHTTPTAAELVKQATAPAHASAEKALIKYIKDIRTARDYALLLGCLYGYFEPLEKQLEPWLVAMLPDYGRRRKTVKLLADVQTLSYPNFQNFSTTLPVVTDLIAALACFYVLEGSVLGGAIIKRIISAQCNTIPPAAFSFFAGYGDATIPMWQCFLVQFNDQLRSTQQVQQAIAAANDCFAKLEEWIRQYYTQLVVSNQ